MITNFRSKTVYKSQVIARIGILVVVWIAIYFFLNVTNTTRSDVVLEVLSLVIIMLLMPFYFIKGTLTPKKFTFWVLLVELFCVILLLYFAYLVIDYINNDNVLYLYISSLLFYSFVFTLRFFFWGRFIIDLKERRKLVETNGFFNYKLNSLDHSEVYHIVPSLSFLKYLSYWDLWTVIDDNSISHKTISVSIISLLFFTTSFGGGTYISYVLLFLIASLYPLLIRGMLAPAIIDFVCGLKFSIGENPKVNFQDEDN